MRPSVFGGAQPIQRRKLSVSLLSAELLCSAVLQSVLALGRLGSQKKSYICPSCRLPGNNSGCKFVATNMFLFKWRSYTRAALLMYWIMYFCLVCKKKAAAFFFHGEVQDVPANIAKEMNGVSRRKGYTICGLTQHKGMHVCASGSMRSREI